MYLKPTIVLFLVYTVYGEEKWTGKWFPHNPDDAPVESPKSTASSSDKWNGKWFPADPNNSTDEKAIKSNSTTTDWKGKWFPLNPNESSKDEVPKVTEPASEDKKDWQGYWFPKNPAESGYKENTYEHDRIMGIPNKDCDDGETNLEVDFDPSKRELYTCLESTYKPNSNLEPIETIYTVPKFYTPFHLCMNETITYDQKIPTLGSHRPLWPRYGEYKYVPPQRWLHSLEHGAIVMLYDSCALSSEVDKLKKLLKACLFRHVITPFKLTKDRPFALVAWGVSLEMSVYDEKSSVEFIKKYAKSGPEKVSRHGQYKKMLIEESKIVSDSDDSEVCGNISSMM